MASLWGNPGGTRYSPLNQINRQNVSQLEIAWEYHTGDFSDGSDGGQKTSFQATPMTYRLRKNGRQFVVIAAGGHGSLGTTIGDSVAAFALPEN